MNALLWAYPARLRERHGAELITTLMDMSGERPSRGDRWHLVLDGLGERFRPPVRWRPFALVVAALALVAGGALGAVAGSLAATSAYAELPSARALADQALGPGADAHGGRHYLDAELPLSPGAPSGPAAEQVRQRLIAAGWTVSAPAVGDGSDGVLSNTHFRAGDGDIELSVYAYDFEQPFVQLAGWPARPASYVPLTIAGALLGMIAGWLLGMALSHRIGAARRPLRSAVLAGTGLTLLLVPSVLFTLSLGYYLGATDPNGQGGLLHTRGITFGATFDLVRAWDLPYELTDAYLYGLLGLVAVAIAAILARSAREPLVREAA
ncbi:hypothetical protein [Symbioplanes lichenis]|uniref:hypothetical protein n=1 Tax=Symbioplanes lichenis TaxID=1629072 RepID=UPI00273A5092|nr:hypothetical protein [Actinoplanes lichenis]